MRKGASDLLQVVAALIGLFLLVTIIKGTIGFGLFLAGLCGLFGLAGMALCWRTAEPIKTFFVGLGLVLISIIGGFVQLVCSPGTLLCFG